MPDDPNKPLEPFSAEQLEKLNGLMGTTVNNILTARLKTTEKQILEKVGLSIGESLKSQLPELLKDFKPHTSSDGGDGVEPGGKGGGKRSQEYEAQLATLRKQQEATNARLDAEVRKSMALREQARQHGIRQRAQKFLENAGIVGDRFDAAYAYLRDRIKLADDVESEDAFFIDPAAGEIELETGLGGWLKTEPAKIFLPANGVRGSGSRPGSGNQVPRNGPITPQERNQRIEAALQDWAERGGT